MLKKALLAGVLGAFLASGAALACNGDTCKVDDPVPVKIGVDLVIDFDVCIDDGNLMDDYWSTNALILQAGEANSATISQSDTSQVAGIGQYGNVNEASISQNAAKEYAFVGQVGDYNYAQVTQTLESARALVGQLGTGNYAVINQ